MKKILLLLITIVFLVSTNSNGQILSFEFSGLAGNEETASSSTNDPNLTSSTISRGAGLTASNNSQRFNATTWALNSISDAVTGNKYMEFTITPNSGYQFSVSSIFINLQRSGTGPRAVALRSSVDGYASNLDQEYSINDVTSTQTFTFTFSQSNSTTPVTYRFYMYAEASGGSGGIGDGSGDDLIVYGSTSSTGTAPAITASETALSGFTYNVGSGPSSNQSFNVEGSDLTADITINPTTNYEISENGITFQSTAITLNQVSGSVASTPIYVRLKSGLSIGDYNGETISISSSGATSKTVTCSGRVEGAQTTSLPYTENLTSGFGKIYTYDGGGDDYWNATSTYAFINGFPNDDAIDNDWMILPGINFSSYSNVELSFDLWWQYGNQDTNNYLKLCYSTDYVGFGDPTAASWTELSFSIPTSDQTWETSGIVDLSSITASNVFIAFEYKSDNAARAWALDNFVVQEHTSAPPTPSVILPVAWINEIHYDNISTDVNEMIEVVIKRADTLSLADFTVTLYNGGNGLSYNSQSLSSFTAGNVNGDYYFFYFIYPPDGIQNGPDGIALDWAGNLIQFISYEGVFAASGGPADGITSSLIGAYETNSKPIGSSIQLVGTGLQYSHFHWVDPVATPGSLNVNQTLGTPPPSVPLDWRYLLLVFAALAATIIYRKIR